MTAAGGFHIATGLDVLPPKSGKAYPIPCDEWELLKNKLEKVSSPPWFYQTVGSVLSGVAGSMLVTILSDTLPQGGQSNARVVAYATVMVSAVCASLSFLFAHQQRDLKVAYVSEVIQQMQIIQNRYETSVTTTTVETLVITSARYGARGMFTDVTEILRKQVQNSTLVTAVGNHICGDPAPNVAKTLEVKYSHNGNSMEKSVEEGGTLSLP